MCWASAGSGSRLWLGVSWVRNNLRRGQKSIGSDPDSGNRGGADPRRAGPNMSSMTSDWVRGVRASVSFGEMLDHDKLVEHTLNLSHMANGAPFQINSIHVPAFIENPAKASVYMLRGPCVRC